MGFIGYYFLSSIIILLTDMVARCRLLAAHGARSCLSVRTQPRTATGAPSQTSTIPYHTIRYVDVDLSTSKQRCTFNPTTFSSVQFKVQFTFCITRMRTHLNSPVNTYYHARPVITFLPSLVTRHRVPGTFGTWHILPSISMVDSVTCLRYTEY